ncbi:hypothetical protein BD410DRAFT_23185 [Rickenella mellea]|uniref:CcmS related domain-containing protein n=1 Tax=Rickenella mellea TaxID=50990 RepID=A0A4R5XED5_9AGAM|nr:hypothetical protein BD410DRAFT_23185 [Rickenella mellea]
MAKKGKQKVTVEEVDDDGLNMIGDLFGEQDDWATGNTRQDNSHDPWSLNPADSASNAHTNTGWGGGGGGAGGGRQTGRSRSNATAAFGQNQSSIHPQQLHQLLHQAQAQAQVRGRQPEKAKKNEAQWKGSGAGGKNVGWNTTWEAGGGGGKGGGKGGSGRGGGAHDSGWGGEADSGWGTHKEPAWGGDDGGWGAAGDQNGDWDTGNDAGGWGNYDDTGWGAEQTGDWSNPADNWDGGGEENDWTRTAPTPQYSQHGQNWEGAHRSKTPKVTVTSPSTVGARTVLSPQEHNQIFSAFFGKNKSGNAQPSGKTQDQKGGGKKGKKKKNQQQQSKLPPMAEVDEYEMVSGDPVHDYWASNAGTSWYGPTYTMPSKTFAHATDGRPSPHSKSAGDSPYLETQFVSSHGEALTLAQKALYSKERLARNRIHWMFNPEKDDRVAGLLEWIQTMSYQLAAFGLNSFLQTRERGALISNADYRPWESPQEPAFDWINFDEVQATKDRTLQESLAFYDPSAVVLVFVFLLSPTGNSMAIWRRKLVIPNNLRLAFGREITQAKAGLRRQYPIHVDEMPAKDMPKSRAKKIESDAQPKRKLSKRKWLRWL